MIPAIQSVHAAATAGSLSAMQRMAQLAQAANLSSAGPSTIVTLGSSLPAISTYNALGLFESLLQLAGTAPNVSDSNAVLAATIAADPAASLATGNSGVAASVDLASLLASNTLTAGDLAALLGNDTVVAGSAIFGAATGSPSLPATIALALTTLLLQDANPRFAVGADVLTVNQTLTRLLASDIKSALAATDIATAISAFLGTTDVLQGMPADLALRSLDRLLSTTDLGFTAALSGLTAQHPLPRLASELTQTRSPLTDSGTNAATAAIASTVSAIATDSSAAASDAATPATASTSASVVPATAVPVVIAAATSTNPTTVDITTTVVAAANPAAVNSASTNATTAQSTAVVAANAGDASAANTTLARSFLEDTATQALANISSNPSYATTAAALYMSAAVFRAHLGAESIPPNLTLRAQPVSAVSRVNVLH